MEGSNIIIFNEWRFRMLDPVKSKKVLEESLHIREKNLIWAAQESDKQVFVEWNVRH